MNAIQTQAVIEFMNEHGADNVNVARGEFPMWMSGPYYIECKDDAVIHYKHGNLHNRDNGEPAILYTNGGSWYEHGKYIKSCRTKMTS